MKKDDLNFTKWYMEGKYRTLSTSDSNRKRDKELLQLLKFSEFIHGTGRNDLKENIVEALKDTVLTYPDDIDESEKYFFKLMKQSDEYQRYKQIFEEAMKEYKLTCVDFYKTDDIARKQYRDNIKNRIHFDVDDATTIARKEEKPTQREEEQKLPGNNPGIELEDE